MQVISQEPPQAQPIGGNLHELILRTKTLEKHNELKLELDDPIDRRTSAGVKLLDWIAHKGKSKGLFEVAIEVVLGHQVLKGHSSDRGEASRFAAHHSLKSSADE